jgi:hypothetical protein
MQLLIRALQVKVRGTLSEAHFELSGGVLGHLLAVLYANVNLGIGFATVVRSSVDLRKMSAFLVVVALLNPTYVRRVPAVQPGPHETLIRTAVALDSEVHDRALGMLIDTVRMSGIADGLRLLHVSSSEDAL